MTTSERELKKIIAKKENLFAILQKLYDLSKDLSTESVKRKFQTLMITYEETKSNIYSVLDEINDVQFEINEDYTPDYKAIQTINELCSYIQMAAESIKLPTNIPLSSAGSGASGGSGAPSLRSSLKIPHPSLPEFHGVYKSMVHLNPNLTNLDRVHLLVGCLKGPAQNMYAGIAIVPDNYDIIYKTLCDKYENKRRCEKFKQLTPNKRYEIVRDNNWCFLCLSSAHGVRNCPSERSCVMCSKKHHVLLHFVRTRQDQELSRSNNNTERDDDPATSNNTGNLQESVETHLCSTLTGNNGSNYTNLLSTVVVSVVNSCIPKSTARFILDTGSQANLVTVNFCKKLGLTVSKYFSSVKGLCGNEQSVRGITTLTIASRYDSSKKYTISALLVEKITDLLPKVCVDVSVIPGLAGICLADNNFDKPGEIHGIIGVELFGMILGKHRISRVTSTPVAVETEFGYVVMGKIPCGPGKKILWLKPKILEPLMASLPSVRVQEAKAFTNTGVDYFGPVKISLGRRKNSLIYKGYGFKRFISRRGPVCALYSDRGTNFVGSKSVLADINNFVNSPEYISAFETELGVQGIEGHFNSPSAPEQGGLWESNVKSVKNHIYRVIGDQLLTYEEFSTLLTEIEALLNSRPLCQLSADPTAPEALTPAHFLTLAPLRGFPFEKVDNIPVNRLDRFQLVDRIVQDFWNRWRLEYLSSLQIRKKWNNQHPNIAVGTVVILKTDNAPPLHWPLAVVTAVHPGSDGVVRNVTLKTSKGIFTRLVVKLCPLPSQ
ncbi:hypothetical protein JTB14_001059 [Gonioctena quinquepunctata]|nr:hypothetical protein JTB14_001059 [Gonioctena quinquepunctata]